MVQAKKKSNTRSRAPLAHKLAKYVRATPINLQDKILPQLPSISHLTYGGPPKRRLRNNAKTWYPADDEKVHFKRKRLQPKAIQPRKSVLPGNIVIILSGKYRGRRVVVLKNALSSGSLLVTGPYAINGVPIRRVNPTNVIATSTKVSLDGVNAANIDDNFFKKGRKFTKLELKTASKQAQEKQTQQGQKIAENWKKQAKQIQKSVDNALMANIKAIEHMRGYIKTRFTLYNNSKPHEMVF